MFSFIIKRPKAKNTVLKQDGQLERIERKFFVSPGKVLYVRSLLSHICLPDSKYPKGQINSLYFDTPNLEHYQKSDDGSYERQKIRIRWYDSPDSKEVVPVYLELKSKRGFAGSKKRKKFLIPAEQLKNLRAGNTIINKNIILQTLAEFDYFSDEPLLPVVMISYERLRFAEILTGTRMSLDWKISSFMTDIIPGHSRSVQILKGAVIEIKGPKVEIPLSLRPLHNVCIDWTRFSKYAGCIESQLEISGSVGQMWPSGRIESY
jgi:hypothetical protein